MVLYATLVFSALNMSSNQMNGSSVTDANDGLTLCVVMSIQMNTIVLQQPENPLIDYVRIASAY